LARGKGWDGDGSTANSQQETPNFQVNGERHTVAPCVALGAMQRRPRQVNERRLSAFSDDENLKTVAFLVVAVALRLRSGQAVTISVLSVSSVARKVVAVRLTVAPCVALGAMQRRPRQVKAVRASRISESCAVKPPTVFVLGVCYMRAFLVFGCCCDPAGSLC